MNSAVEKKIFHGYILYTFRFNKETVYLSGPNKLLRGQPSALNYMATTLPQTNRTNKQKDCFVKQNGFSKLIIFNYDWLHDNPVNTNKVI